MKRNIYLDCTDTFNNKLNTGIQRVVRNIVNNSEKISKDLNVNIKPVININNQYYILKDVSLINNSEMNTLKKIEIVSKIKKTYKSLNKIIKFKPSFVSYMSLKIRDIELMLNINKSDFEKVKFKKNDILLLIDTTWKNSFFKHYKKLKQNQVKIIPLIYDIIPLTHSQYCGDLLKEIFENWFKNIIPIADGYIGISNTVKEEVYNYFVKDFGIKISKEKFEYFYLGADFQKFDKIKLDNIGKSFQNLFSKKDTYITVSTIEPRKNHEFILDAFEKLWEENINVKYIMIGKIGWKINSFIKRVKSHKEYNKRLFLLNNVSDEELVYAYKNSKALVFASKIEGFGLPIVESLYFGLPVLVSDIPVHREIGKGQVTYFSLENVEDLVNKIKNEELKKVKNYQWLNWFDSTKMLIEKSIKILDIK